MSGRVSEEVYVEGKEFVVEERNRSRRSRRPPCGMRGRILRVREQELLWVLMRITGMNRVVAMDLMRMRCVVRRVVMAVVLTVLEVSMPMMWMVADNTSQAETEPSRPNCYSI